MHVYIWASGICMEITDVKLIDGCVPSIGETNRGVPLSDLPRIEPAVWFKVLVLDGVSIDCLRRAIMWNCDSALTREKRSGARMGYVGASDDDVTRKQRITESVYNGGEFFAYNMEDMFRTIQDTASAYKKGELSLETLHEQLLRMLHCYILPAIPITADALPRVKEAYSTQQQFIKKIDEDIVEQEQKTSRHDRARHRQMLKFVESLTQQESTTLGNGSRAFVDILYADVQKEVYLAKEAFEISQHLVQEAKRKHAVSSVDITYVNNKRELRDKNHEQYAALLRAREVLKNHVTRDECQQNSLTHAIRNKLKPRPVEALEPLQATYNKLSEMGHEMQEDTISLIEKKLLMLSVKEAIRNTISELQVAQDSLGIDTNKLLCSRSTDVLGSSSVTSEWMSIEDRVSRLLDDSKHPITERYHRFCAHILELSKAALSEKQIADCSLLASFSKSETSSDSYLHSISSWSAVFSDSLSISPDKQSNYNKPDRVKWFIGDSKPSGYDTHSTSTCGVNPSSCCFENSHLMDSTRVHLSTSEFTSSDSNSDSPSDLIPDQSFYSTPTPSVGSRDSDSTYSFVCYLESCPYACCTPADREVFILGENEPAVMNRHSTFTCYLGNCDTCKSIERKITLLKNIPEISPQSECMYSSLSVPIIEGTDVLSCTEERTCIASASSNAKKASYSVFDDSFASSGVFSQMSLDEQSCSLTTAGLAYDHFLQLDNKEGLIGGCDWSDAVIIHDTEQSPVRKLIDRIKQDIPKHIKKTVKRLSSELDCNTEEVHKRIHLRYECHLFQTTFDSLIQLYETFYAPTCTQFKTCLRELTFADLELDSSIVASMVCDDQASDGTYEFVTKDETCECSSENGRQDGATDSTHAKHPSLTGVIMRGKQRSSRRHKLKNPVPCTPNEPVCVHLRDSGVHPCDNDVSVSSVSKSGDLPLKSPTHSDLSEEALSNERQSRVLLLGKTPPVCEQLLESASTRTPPLGSTVFEFEKQSENETDHTLQSTSKSCGVVQKCPIDSKTVSLPDAESPNVVTLSEGQMGETSPQIDTVSSHSRVGGTTGVSLLPEALAHLQPAVECIRAAINEKIPLLKLQHLTACLREVNKQVYRLQCQEQCVSVGACSDDLIDTLTLLLCHQGANYTSQLYAHILFLNDFIPTFFINGPYNFALVQFSVAFQFLQDRLVLLKKYSSEHTV